MEAELHENWTLHRVGFPETTYHLQAAKNTILIGRIHGDILCPSSTVSRIHAQLILKENAWHVVDLSSLNGVHVKSTTDEQMQKIVAMTPERLWNGDLIRFGLSCADRDDTFLFEVKRTVIKIHRNVDRKESSVGLEDIKQDIDNSTEWKCTNAVSSSDEDEVIASTGCLKHEKDTSVTGDGTECVGQRNGKTIVLKTKIYSRKSQPICSQRSPTPVLASFKTHAALPREHQSTQDRLAKYQSPLLTTRHKQDYHAVHIQPKERDASAFFTSHLSGERVMGSAPTSRKHVSFSERIHVRYYNQAKKLLLEDICIPTI